MTGKTVPKIGDLVRWKWRAVPLEGGGFRTDYLEGTVVALYGPPDNPITVDTETTVGIKSRSAHRWWDLEILPASPVPLRCSQCDRRGFREQRRDGPVAAACSAYRIQTPIPWLPDPDANCEPPNWCPLRPPVTRD